MSPIKRATLADGFMAAVLSLLYFALLELMHPGLVTGRLHYFALVVLVMAGGVVAVHYVRPRREGRVFGALVGVLLGAILLQSIGVSVISIVASVSVFGIILFLSQSEVDA